MTRVARQYEFPTGFNTYFGPERFTVGEQYFRHSADLIVRLPNRDTINHNKTKHLLGLESRIATPHPNINK